MSQEDLETARFYIQSKTGSMVTRIRNIVNQSMDLRCRLLAVGCIVESHPEDTALLERELTEMYRELEFLREILRHLELDMEELVVHARRLIEIVEGSKRKGSIE
ncbi:MAG: hypothetical protein OWQ48_05795 [Desulfurococcus sp.]|nr:hypothetical protein [Desulfurococcus sp.]